jgi:hypothetical protein
MERASRFPRNYDSTTSQAWHAVEPWAEMISPRSLVSVATIQDLTTQSPVPIRGTRRGGVLQNVASEGELVEDQ